MSAKRTRAKHQKHADLRTSRQKHGGREDECISKVAKTVDEAKALVEAGFEYVCDIEG
jgi:hypothetical protein